MRNSYEPHRVAGHAERGEEVYSAEFAQPLETAGKRSKRIEVASIAIKSAEAELQERSASLAYAIRAEYAELQSERHKVALFADIAKANDEALRLTEARVKEGDAPALDANLLKVEISRFKAQAMSAQRRLASADMEPRRLTGLSGRAVLPSTDPSPPVELSLAQLRSKHSEIAPIGRRHG